MDDGCRIAAKFKAHALVPRNGPQVPAHGRRPGKGETCHAGIRYQLFGKRTPAGNHADCLLGKTGLKYHIAKDEA